MKHTLFALFAVLALSACNSGGGSVGNAQSGSASNALILHSIACNELYGSMKPDGFFRYNNAPVPSLIMLIHGGGGSQLRSLASWPDLPPSGNPAGITYRNEPGKFEMDMYGIVYSWDYSSNEVIYRVIQGGVLNQESRTSKDCKSAVTVGYADDGVTVAANFQAQVVNGILNGAYNSSHYDQQDMVTLREEYSFNYSLSTQSGSATHKNFENGVLQSEENHNDSYSPATNCTHNTVSCAFSTSGCFGTYTVDYCL